MNEMIGINVGFGLAVAFGVAVSAKISGMSTGDWERTDQSFMQMGYTGAHSLSIVMASVPLAE